MAKLNHCYNETMYKTQPTAYTKSLLSKTKSVLVFTNKDFWLKIKLILNPMEKKTNGEY